MINELKWWNWLYETEYKIIKSSLEKNEFKKSVLIIFLHEILSQGHLEETGHADCEEWVSSFTNLFFQSVVVNE